MYFARGERTGDSLLRHVLIVYQYEFLSEYLNARAYTVVITRALIYASQRTLT